MRGLWLVLTAAMLPAMHCVEAGEVRRLACLELYATDGDSVTCDGTNMRDMGDGAPNVSGYDTPETRQGRYKCDREFALGKAATARMIELRAAKGVYVIDSGEVDRFDRPLVWVKLADGSSIGSILIKEGHARRWTPDYKANWCGS
ncbi:MAG: thermonuclease family protein [Candidatus Nitrotoga sp.]